MMEKSPLERVNIETGNDSPSSDRFRRSPPSRPPIDELLGLLSSARRRRLVASLDSEDGLVSLSDAVARVAESEGGDQRKPAVTTEFHHVHLPKLTDAGVVRYDREADALEAGPNAELVARLLESVTGDFSPDSRDGHRSDPLAETRSTDAVFRLLADGTRRFILSTFGGSDERVHLANLAERVAAWRGDKPVANVTADERKGVELELHHKHLPMLADAGMLEYDPETKTLSDWGRPVAAAEWLASSPTLETLRATNGV